MDFPDDESMRISHETIYQSLYVRGRGALKRELTACLRTGRALREPRARTQRSGRSYVTDDVRSVSGLLRPPTGPFRDTGRGT
jgi:IS30 family transposase